MIVRVELMGGSSTVPMASVESKDGKVRFAVPLTEAIKGRLNGKVRGYFHASRDDKTASFEIGEAARAEQW